MAHVINNACHFFFCKNVPLNFEIFDFISILSM